MARSATPKAPFDPDEFRDHIGTVDESGNRRWVFPKKPKGKYYNARTWVSILLLSLLFIGPFLKWDGEPLLLFNLIERKFIIFSLTFWPQDFYLFVLALITFFIFVVLFTVVFGRVWCGWACPQTLFMEMVFRKIEYWIEGDSVAQRKLAKAPWNGDKIRKRALKWTIFYVLSFFIANLVMAYVVGVDELSKIVTESPYDNWGKFTFVMVFSVIFFFVFAWFREQACIVVCPYGRLQGVLLTQESIVVAYDHVRGEERGKFKQQQKLAEEGKPHGDCIDCHACVAVCPTGIDIRNGTQMECVNCTACIDACDEIMDKVERPRGLIRYDSEAGISTGIRNLFNKRVIAYTIVFAFLFSFVSYSIATRANVETVLLRTPGMLYQRQDDGYISNLYNIQLINKTRNEYPLEIRIVEPESARIKLVGESITVKAQEIAKGVLFIEIPESELHGKKNLVRVEIWSGDELLDRTKVNFFGPIKK
ncbi:cytochrome c oxidase accessory protein CcoG [Pontibacter sp. G13]|uniref:cytochrome c oxidase accessory protein CcoG n=1 Tax=Pontibacter sp. G13 TaxID=3074898 RepID=UPI00288A1F84|nr:cytochrome c oxidase accessory protein CcoG [Pontibacter sp. G13]WNJ16109.1 cytochrome c oxidase accessory protein CcoG [Pontibacter sp. G13]